MIELAQRNAARAPGGAPTNVEFHLASIDHMPLPDASVDCVISNCVINLVPDKRAVFREVARVLRPGGRVAISDIALKRPLPPALAEDVAAYVGCIAGAIPIEDYRAALLTAGFEAVEIIDSGADLNAYSQLDRQAACCAGSSTSTASLPVAPSSCCGTSSSNAAATTDGPADAEPDLHERLAALVRQYDVNEYAASVRVFAIKPRA